MAQQLTIQKTLSVNIERHCFDSLRNYDFSNIFAFNKFNKYTIIILNNCKLYLDQVHINEIYFLDFCN